jgi:hypothetical protein
MSAVSKNRVKRLISQIGDVDAVHGEGSTSPFRSLVITEDGSNIVATDGSGGATTFLLDLAVSSDNGCQFEGTDDYMKVPVTGLTPAVGTWWFEFTLNEPTNNRYLFSKEAGSPSNHDMFYLYWKGHSAYDGLMYGGIKTWTGSANHASEIPSLDVLTSGRKYQAALTFDGATVKFYMDSGPGVNPAMVLQGSDPNTGTLYYGSTDYYFAVFYQEHTQTPMRFSDIAFFDGALDILDLAELKAGTKTPTDTFIGGHEALAWWPFVETSGTTVADATGNGRTATLVNGPTFDTAAEGWTLANPTGLTAGQTYRWCIETGGARPCTFGSKFKSPGAGSMQISQGLGESDVIIGTVSADGSFIYCEIKKDFS